MARTYTRAEMRDRIRFYADLVGATQFATDAQINELINVHLSHVWNLLVQAGPPDYYTSEATITTTTATSYALSSDFLAVLQVYVNESSSRKRPVREVQDLQRTYYKPCDSGITVTVEYVPTAGKLAADSDTFDGVNGYEDLICALAARDLRLREGLAQEGMLESKIMELRSGIRNFAGRNRGQATKITDVSAFDWAPWTSGVTGYRVRGANIELYNDMYPFYP